MKSNVIALSIFSLALAIVLGSWLIAEGLRENAVSGKEIVITTTPTKETIQAQIFTITELASYLGLSEADVEKLGPASVGDGITTSILPYLRIDDTVYYPKEAVDRWLREMEIDIAY
ncbi:helix-turn-helix domain-containing protein [Sporosarcina sp. YIM B06819]|uniref:helix-turn-helix domain-containing protein n=1 Tax=Sporosarcina sp. YIM B06819 TaxID=3081769 RepID=UPI00298BFB8C|nr:helix-turn-helix domain-containing protein [Sporosarcina sp. YIM B06819]